MSSDALHIWWARLDGQKWPDAERLPALDRNRAERIPSAKARSRWVGSRWALRGVLARYTGHAPEEVELCAGPRGKLTLAARASPRFNLSHSGDMALIVVARGREVGVDIEQIRPRSNLRRLISRVLSPAEAELVEASPSRSRLTAFHSAWVRAEAVAKCLGTGLAGPAPKITVAVRNFDAGPRFAAAVATAGDIVPPLHHFAFGPADVGASAKLGRAVSL